jgi:transcriptional regulator with XRE-family HTH domain
MSERSRQVSPENLERVRKRLRDCSLNQTALAEDLKISRSTVSKFFRGEAIDRSYFESICARLGFEWEEVVAQPPEKLEETHKTDIDQLVQATREKIKPIIHERCGTMRVLDILSLD